MYKIYDRWPQIARESYESEQELAEFGEINHIVFSGMGGSGAIGDVFSSILSKTKIHVCVVKGYVLPGTIDSNTLVVTTSVSGNTTETLSVLDTASKLGCKVIAFSSGGKMERFCVKNKVEYRKIPMVLSPRASFPAFLYSMLKILSHVIPVKNDEVTESISKLERLQKSIWSSNLTINNPSLALAEWINGIPMIYYPHGLEAVAIRFKNSLQENAKSHAMAEDVIEASHNGIVSWERNKFRVQPILIEGADDYIKTKERWNILKEYFKKNKIDYKEIHSIKGGILSKSLTLMYLLDYCTLYLAALSKLDPSPVRSIDYLKNKLG
ncbi:MAG: SIS domain-containing protein [Thaumarchaeota archaeon]|nr:SIS domain-containing protein [Nitrososphaerota archaeon]